MSDEKKELKLVESETEESTGNRYPKELREKCKRLFAVIGSISELQEYLPVQVNRKTLGNWKNEDNWDEARKEFMDKGIEIQEFIYAVSKMGDKEVDEKLGRISKEVLATVLISFQLDLKKNPQNAILMSAPFQRLMSALEKIVGSEIKMKTGGVKQSETRVIKYDFDKILELQLEYRRRGLQLSAREAMDLMDAAGAKDVTKKTDGDH